jgi:putative ABC transport system permease protein
VLSLLTTVAFGVVPAIQFWRSDIRSTLQSARGSTGPARQRVRQALVIGEVAIALVLLMGAGLLFRSFVRLLSVDPGFAKERVLALQVFLRNNFEKPDQFFDQSLQKIAAVPGVESAAVVSSPPFINFETDTTFNIVGRPAPPSGSEPTAFYSQVSSDYLKTLGVPLKRGRFLTSFDRAETRPVVVINEAMARRYFANEEPVGKQLSVMYGEPVTCEIVGVVGNVLHSGLHAEPRPEMFVPHQQSPSTQMTFLVKTAPDAETMLPAVKQAIREVNNNQTFAKTATMEELVADSLKQRRFNLFLLGLFAAIALLLATVGIYGSISYMARQRTNEIGVRIALGAQSRDVLKLIVGQGLGLAVAGVVIGLLCAFLLTRTISGLLFGVGPMDPLTFMVISLLLLATAFVASLIPARRATKVDPLTALRSE